jgi:hypothetical protein
LIFRVPSTRGEEEFSHVPYGIGNDEKWNARKTERNGRKEGIWADCYSVRPVIINITSTTNSRPYRRRPRHNDQTAKVLYYRRRRDFFFFFSGGQIFSLDWRCAREEEEEEKRPKTKKKLTFSFSFSLVPAQCPV